MKKYRFLEAGEIIKSGDQFKHAEDAEWYDCEIAIGNEIFKGDEGYFRRPIPLEFENRFLVCLSIIVPVEIDCTGLTSEQIDEKISEMAVDKIIAAPDEYVTTENIDWDETRLDSENFQPQYRELSEGETVQEWDFYLRESGRWQKISENEKRAIPNHTVKDFEVGRFKRKIQ